MKRNEKLPIIAACEGRNERGIENEWDIFHINIFLIFALYHFDSNLMKVMQIEDTHFFNFSQKWVEGMNFGRKGAKLTPYWRILFSLGIPPSHFTSLCHPLIQSVPLS